MRASHMAVDQHGQTYHGLAHPRRDLLQRLGRKHAAKMYRDPDARHCGYIIGSLWLEVFRVSEWHAPQGGTK